MQEVHDAIACHGCDALLARPALGRRQVAHCPRCGTELARDPGRLVERLLPLAVAGVVLFAIANLFPIVEIELRGLHSQTTLVGAVVELTRSGMSEVALLVLGTTLLFPLAQLCIICYLLTPWPGLGLDGGGHRRAPGFNVLVRLLQSLKPWGMIEVFLLGVLVAVIKLSGMATVLAGPALWAFVALTVLLTAMLAFDPRTLWDRMEQLEAGERAR